MFSQGGDHILLCFINVRIEKNVNHMKNYNTINLDTGKFDNARETRLADALA